ncbi:MAG: hypothetical protein FWF30_04035 [Coriobacteriia bacterium]|nr:hypothetical protein [Coriobacteriia bacterium]
MNDFLQIEESTFFETAYLPGHLLATDFLEAEALEKTVHLASSQPDFAFSLPLRPLTAANQRF